MRPPIPLLKEYPASLANHEGVNLNRAAERFRAWRGRSKQKKAGRGLPLPA